MRRCMTSTMPKAVKVGNTLTPASDEDNWRDELPSVPEDGETRPLEPKQVKRGKALGSTPDEEKWGDDSPCVPDEVGCEDESPPVPVSPSVAFDKRIVRMAKNPHMLTATVLRACTKHLQQNPTDGTIRVFVQMLLTKLVRETLDPTADCVPHDDVLTDLEPKQVKRGKALGSIPDEEQWGDDDDAPADSVPDDDDVFTDSVPDVDDTPTDPVPADIRVPLPDQLAYLKKCIDDGDDTSDILENARQILWGKVQVEVKKRLDPTVASDATLCALLHASVVHTPSTCTPISHEMLQHVKVVEEVAMGHIAEQTWSIMEACESEAILPFAR